jgi:hypothetical protein
VTVDARTDIFSLGVVLMRWWPDVRRSQDRHRAKCWRRFLATKSRSLWRVTRDCVAPEHDIFRPYVTVDDTCSMRGRQRTRDLNSNLKDLYHIGPLSDAMAQVYSSINSVAMKREVPVLPIS